MKKHLTRVLFASALVTAVAGVAQMLPSGAVEPAASKLPPGVPAAVDNLRIDHDDTYNSGYVTFNMPSKTYGGEVKESDERCKYSIEVNGELVVDNKLYWYCDEAALAVAAEGRSGYVEATVWATNDDGDGPKTTVKEWLGEDTPAPIANINLEMTDTSFELSWTPTTTLHGGNYDQSCVAYTVYQYPGGKEIGRYNSAKSSLSIPITDELPTGSYYFGIVMDYWDVDNWSNGVYDMAFSNTIIVNPLQVPYEHTFTAADAATYTTFNIDENTSGWTFAADGATVSFDNPEPKDDWIITPPFKASADYLYSVDINVGNSNDYPERIEVKAGKGNMPQDMTIAVIEPQEFDGGAAHFTGTFQIEDADVMYLGFHACSDADMYNLRVKSYSVGIAQVLKGPKAPENFSAEPYYLGEGLQVKVALNVPTTDYKGNQLTSIEKLTVTRDGEVIKTVDSPAPGQYVNFFDTVEEDGSYTYAAYVTVDGVDGGAATTTAKVKAPMQPDFHYGFMPTSASEFTVINANNDDNTWTFANGGTTCYYNPDIPMDDWLISFPIKLEAGKVYEIATLAGDNGYQERLKVYLADEQSIDADKTLISELETVGGGKKYTIKGNYESRRTQIKYILFHGCSDPDQNGLSIYSFDVTAVGDCEALSSDHDLRIKSITTDTQHIAGNVVPVSVTVENCGLEAIGNYTVTLYADGEEVDSAECNQLSSGRTQVVDMKFNTSIFHGDFDFTLYAEVSCDEDEVADNDKSDEVSIHLNHPQHPAVTDLSAVAADGTVTLSWSAPSTDGTGSVAVVDNVESYPAFSIGLPDSEVADDNVGDWIMVDRDGLGTYLLGSIKWPNNQTQGAYPKAWQVIDSDQGNIYCFSASGHQCFGCLAAVPKNGQGNDDWMISPELSGYAQTISFNSRSYDSNYNETYEVLYSEGSINPDDFILIATQVVDDEENWVNRSYDLPAGAKRFAIRCTSLDRYALFVDDIAYEAASADNKLEIKGYNVYRNQELVVEEPIAATSFAESNLEDGTHNYHVSVMYDRGESTYSNTAVVVMEASGVGSAVVAGVKVSVADYVITVEGVDNDLVEIYALNGQKVFAAVVDGNTSVAVNGGVYIVRTGKTAVKVIARN